MNPFIDKELESEDYREITRDQTIQQNKKEDLFITSLDKISSTGYNIVLPIQLVSMDEIKRKNTALIIFS